MNGSQRGSIGGWLLYYCVSRSVFEPVYFVWSARKLGSPIELWIEVFFALAGLFAVFLIAKRRQMAFIWIGSDLILRVLFGVAALIRKYLHPMTRPNQKTDPHLIAFIVFAIGLVGPVAWFLYFRRSKRVRTVLGKNIGIVRQVRT